MTSDRRLIPVEIPPDLWARLCDEADALGLAPSDHASALLSQALRETLTTDGGDL